MANLFSNDRAGTYFTLSNGATDVFISVLLLSGSDLAVSAWEKELIVWLAETDQSVYGRGCVGFDVGEIAWEKETFFQQKDFLLRVIDVAATKHRWSVLDYKPPFAQEYLSQFRGLVEAYSVDYVADGQKWTRQIGRPEDFVKCPIHAVYMHEDGCTICHDD